MQITNATLFTGVNLRLREHPHFKMQSINATLCTGFIVCFRQSPLYVCKVHMTLVMVVNWCLWECSPLLPDPKYKCDVIYWDFIFIEYLPLPLSNCKVQMQHYLLGIFYAVGWLNQLLKYLPFPLDSWISNSNTYIMIRNLQIFALIKKKYSLSQKWMTTYIWTIQL